MIRFVFLSFTALSGLVYGSFQDSQGSSISELRPRSEKLVKFSQTKTERQWIRQIENSILEANPNLLGLQNQGYQKLAKAMFHTAKCYEIDPAIFTALIWRESNFKPQSVSDTGAVGLSQMTFYGIHEVLDRVNSKSFRNIKSLSALVARCNPSIASQIPDDLTLDEVLKWKSRIAKDAQLSLVFGALLVKVHVSRSPLTLQSADQIYRYALIKYNGDPRVKVRFAEDILFLAKMINVKTRGFVSRLAQVETDSNGSKFLRSILKF